jgi:putative heme-binding domain-containing protein
MKRLSIQKACILSLLVCCPVLHAQNSAGRYAQADIQYGARIYAGQCTSCHGETGDLISGVDFRAGRFKRVISDNDLRNTVLMGVSGTGMPPFKFNESEVVGIIAYIRNMRDFDARAVAVGDEARGRKLFEEAGKCMNCHRVNGNGSRVAPDLSDIGTVRTAAALERSLLDPNAAMLPVNRFLRAVTRDGKTITGRRLNEGTYTVQLIDEHENLVSLDKSELREYTVMKESPMPSYKDKFSPNDLADVIAYLLSLRGLK